MTTPNVIYQKTPKGIAEIAASERALNFRQRQVLILVDGKRSHEEIGLFLNQRNMTEMLAELEKLGHIHNPAKPASAAPTRLEIIPAEPAPEPASMSEEQVQHIKGILIASTEQHLGIMGRSLKQKIEAAISAEVIVA
ncbi:MAG: hypothetical protein WC696_08545, partial [Candidatus Methylopumilus sp.]